MIHLDLKLQIIVISYADLPVWAILWLVESLFHLMMKKYCISNFLFDIEESEAQFIIYLSFLICIIKQSCYLESPTETIGRLLIFSTQSMEFSLSNVVLEDLGIIILELTEYQQLVDYDYAFRYELESPIAFEFEIKNHKNQKAVCRFISRKNQLLQFRNKLVGAELPAGFESFQLFDCNVNIAHCLMDLLAGMIFLP